jgi:hypothetical protein
MIEDMNRPEFLGKQYENILGWYRQAEDKSKFLVTINTFAGGLVNALLLVASNKVARVGALYSFSIWGLLLLTAIALVASFIFILIAVYARHRGSEPELNSNEKLWFFGHIAEMTREDYQARMRNCSAADIEATMTAQNHILAGNVKTKFDALNRAMALTIATLILLFLLGVACAMASTNTAKILTALC